MNVLKNFWKDDSGATAIEYALIATLIAMAIIASFGLMLNNIGVIMNESAGEIKDINDAKFN